MKQIIADQRVVRLFVLKLLDPPPPCAVCLQEGHRLEGHLNLDCLKNLFHSKKICDVKKSALCKCLFNNGCTCSQIYFYAEAQTTHITYPDGMEVLHFPNNQTGENKGNWIDRTSLSIWLQ